MNQVKFILAGISIMMLFPEEAFTQPDIGLFIGLNNTRFSGDEPADGSCKIRVGFTGSVHMDFRLTEFVRLSIQPGIASAGSTVLS